MSGASLAHCRLSILSDFSAYPISSAALTAANTSLPSSPLLLPPKAVLFLLLSKSELPSGSPLW